MMPANVAPVRPELYGENEDELNALIKCKLDEARPGKKNARERTKQARAVYAGDEWAFADHRNLNGHQLSLKLPKSISEEVIAIATQDDFELTVKADPVQDLPPNHPFHQQLAQFGPQLGLAGEDEAGIASDLFTHALGTVREDVHLDDLAPEALEAAFTDGTGCSYLWDGTGDSELVIDSKLFEADVVWKDVHATSWRNACKTWVCIMWPTTKEALAMRFPKYAALFEEKDDTEGECLKTTEAKDAKPSGNERTIQEHFIGDPSMEMFDGFERPKYPGGLKRVYRYKDTILEVSPNPYPHLRVPLQQVKPFSKPGSADGMCFVLDILYDLCLAKNKVVTLALWNMVLTANNKRLINPKAVMNAAALANNSISNIVLNEGYTFEDAVKELRGSEISQAFIQVGQMLGADLNALTGQQTTPAPGGKGNDMVKSGLRAGTVRRSWKRALRGWAYNVVHNLIGFVDSPRAWRVMGGVGPDYITFNPAIFFEALNYFNARFSIVVHDAVDLAATPKEKVEAFTEIMKLAAEIAQTAQVSLSRAVEMLPNLPEKGRIYRQLKKAEAEREEARRRAREAGEPDPAQQEAMMTAQRDRGDAAAEIAKKLLQKLTDLFPLQMGRALVNGEVDLALQLAQGFVKPGQANLPIITQILSQQPPAALPPGPGATQPPGGIPV